MLPLDVEWLFSPRRARVTSPYGRGILPSYFGCENEYNGGGQDMRKKILRITVVALSLILMGAWTALAVDVPRMSKEALKERLADPDVIILDVRTGGDWKASEFKIKGAVRASSDNVDSWAAKYAKDKTLVLYCA